MGIKSRGNYSVNVCIGPCGHRDLIAPNGFDYCDKCIGKNHWCPVGEYCENCKFAYEGICEMHGCELANAKQFWCKDYEKSKKN